MPFLDVEGLNLYYRWSPAQGSRPVLVLIHGLGSSHAYYAPLVPLLNQRGYSCLAIDTPGSGLSNHDGRDRSPAHIASVFKALLLRLAPDQDKVLVGHSMGSMIACELARHVRAAGVVLIGPVHPTTALANVFNARIKVVEESGLEQMADTVPTAATGTLSTPLHHAFIRSLILSQTVAGYVSLCRTIADAEPPPYDMIEAPLLIVAGSDDKTSPLSGCESISERWNGAHEKRLVILDGVGHWHCIEAPDRVAIKILEFADALSQ
ncbi:hypothetical protein N3K66_007935 [Trichothecium roseum]|uniref:Uncharacterized protein n=1 Tax=Trichothecium roseum TaxID=47278 RepID=A0ACC0US23_9HYPO|nr:hypothetical protein N3K66_007935 [Trichothecium roseum]